MLIGWLLELWQPSSRPGWESRQPTSAPTTSLALHLARLLSTLLLTPPASSPPQNLPKSCRRRRLLHPCVPRHHRHVAPPPGHPVGVERLLLQHRGRHPPGAQGGWRGGRGGAGLRDRLLPRLALPLTASHRSLTPHALPCAGRHQRPVAGLLLLQRQYPLKSVTLNGKPLDRNEFQVGGAGPCVVAGCSSQQGQAERLGSLAQTLAQPASTPAVLGARCTAGRRPGGVCV